MHKYDVTASMQFSGEWSLLIVGNNNIIACTGKYIVNLFLV